MSAPPKHIDLRSYARTFTRSAVRTLAHVMRAPESPPAARVAAATVLLDRGWGRAPQHVQLDGDVKHLLEVKLTVVEPTTNLLANPELSNDIKTIDLSATQVSSEPEPK